MRFSIIVPVYNAVDYLGDCLDSVFAQTFGDFEIICVDDGSDDGSQTLLEDRSFGEERMHVVQKANAGPSSARNDGIRIAQGEYLCFLDADDTLEPNALERISRALDEKPCDAVVFGWSYFPEGEADRFVRERARVRDARFEEFSPDLLFAEMTNPYLRLAVRREALEQSGVRFDESLRVGEDAQFLFALYPRIKGVTVVSDKLYRYRLPHDGSVMAEYKFDVPNLCASDLNAAIAIFADWNKAGFLQRYGSQLVHWFVRGQLYTILRQSPEVREPLTALVRQMLAANFTAEELEALELDAHALELLRMVMASDDEGKLAVGEKELARALLSWRIAEYGVADLAVTAVERAGAYLHKNRHMLLKGRGPSRDVAPAEGGASASDVLDEANAVEVERPGAVAEAEDNRGEGNLAVDAKAHDGDTPEFDGDAPIVSVVVPIYNVERYLDQALESIRAQTLRALEIICVNDGSTDSSCDIVKRHADLDGRIKLVDKPNAGYGSACNRGIAEARGRWIAIVEPDDWIEPGMYAAMVEHANSLGAPVDIVKTPYWRIWMPDTDRQRRVNCSYRGRVKPAAQPFVLTDPGATHLIIHHPSIWSALYRRDFLEEFDIRFLEIPGAGWADNPFLVETLCQARAIAYLDEPFYNYREETPEKTASVALNSWQVSLDRWHDMCDVYERLGVDDPNILRAHVRRGFTYIELILEYHDLDAEDDVRERVKSVFARMDDGLVFAEPHISPASKRLYAKVKGIEEPAVSPFPYAREVVKAGLYNVVNTGPAMTLDTLKAFFAGKASRERKE